MILDPQLAFVHAPELDGPEAYVPEAVVDFLEAFVFAGERLRDAHAARLPADAAVLADKTDFEMAWELDLRKLLRELPRRRLVGRRSLFRANRFLPDWIANRTHVVAGLSGMAGRQLKQLDLGTGGSL